LKQERDGTVGQTRVVLLRSGLDGQSPVDEPRELLRGEVRDGKQGASTRGGRHALARYETLARRDSTGVIDGLVHDLNLSQGMTGTPALRMALAFTPSRGYALMEGSRAAREGSVDGTGGQPKRRITKFNSPRASNNTRPD
jgi:hypothetical protein